jgi:hypothetical protein
MIRKKLKIIKDNWKRIAVILLCIILIAVHLIWPRLVFDSINIWLGVIILVFLFLPDGKIFMPYIKRVKRFKAWELEFELGELGEKVEKVEAENRDSEASKNVSPEVEEVLREAASDPRAALLLLSTKIETTIKQVVEEAKIDDRYSSTSPRFLSTARAIEDGLRTGLFPESIISAYMDFRSIRNKIAHDYTFDVDDSAVLSLISLGSELLKQLTALAAKKVENE